MSAPTLIPEIVSELTGLVKSGQLDVAKERCWKLRDRIEAPQMKLVAHVVWMRENRPNVARKALGALWLRSNEADRALIAACMPEKGEPLPGERVQAPRAPRRKAPSRVTSAQRDDLIRGRRSRQEQQSAAGMASYEGERLGVAEGSQLLDRDDRNHAAKPYGSGFDYDDMATVETDVAFRCLGCLIGRGLYDLDRARIVSGRGDDGLCKECREGGAVGIPELTVNLSRRDAMRARCEFVFEKARAEFGVAIALQALKSQWREARNIVDQAAIGQFGKERTAEHAKVSGGQVAELVRCVSCTKGRKGHDVRGKATDDGLCKECRAADARVSVSVA